MSILFLIEWENFILPLKLYISLKFVSNVKKIAIMYLTKVL